MRDAARPQKEKNHDPQTPCRRFHPEQFTATGFKIDRDQILAKYWELANLTPEETKGNITGQLKALDALCEELRLKPNTDTVKPRPAHKKSTGRHGCRHDLPTN